MRKLTPRLPAALITAAAAVPSAPCQIARSAWIAE